MSWTDRLVDLGWSVQRVLERPVHDRPSCVTTVLADKGPMHLRVTVVPGALGEYASSYLPPPLPCTLEYAAGDGRVRLEILDEDRAREELGTLLPELRRGWYREAVATVEARGWRVDRERTDERTEYDEPAYWIHATRGDEYMEVGALAFGEDRGRGIVCERGTARIEVSGARYHARVVTLAPARELATALEPQGPAPPR